MANNIIKRVWNQNKMVSIEALQGMAFQAEDGGHTFEISGVDDSGNPVALSGTVAGVFVRPDNADIALSGTASDGKVYVTLSDACYTVPGKFGLTIFVMADSKKTAVYAAIGTVTRTSGGAVAGDTPQDVLDLINAIEAAVATIPASYSGLMADIAPTYSSSAVYPVGAYVYYNGDLYRCTTAITTAETWTAAHWTAVALGNDVCELNSSVRNYALYPSENVPGQTIYSTYSIGGDSWTGHMNACFRYGDPVYGGIKNLKVAAKLENSTIYVLVMKEENGSYIIEKTYSKSSGNSGYVEFNNIQFEGFKYIAIRGPFVARTDIGVHNGYIGTSTVNVGDNTDSLTKNTTYGIIWNFVILSQPATGIDPDSFTGTDSEKLQKTFDYLQITGGSICIRRQFTIESTIIIRHLYEKNNRIVVYGVSKNSIIKVNTLYGFKGLNGSTGGVIFRDLIITGTSNVSHSVLTGGNTENGEELISIIFENCYINNFPVIFNATNYVQHISFHNCIIRAISSGMYNSGGYQFYGCNVQNCVIEQASIGTIYYAEAVNIKNNIIEGSPSRTCINIANAYALNIEGNYFEANGTDISMSSITGTDRNIRIIGNFFANSSSSIVLPDTASAEYSSAIVIMNNKQIGNSPVLVKGQSDQEYIDVFCAFNSGNVTDLPTESLKVITSQYFWN